MIQSFPKELTFLRKVWNTSKQNNHKCNNNYIESNLLVSTDTIASVLCIPIVQDNGGLLGVLTVGRKYTEPRFSSEDEDIAKFYLSWTSETLSLAQEHMLCHQQQKLNAIYKKIIM